MIDGVAQSYRADKTGVSTSDQRWITVRYPGSCISCQSMIERGDRALYDGTARTVTCVMCGPPTVPVPLDRGAPGASAKREHERRKAAREDRARQRFGRVGVVAVRLVGEPQHQAAWAKGQTGEVKLAVRLEELLAGSGVVLLHDRRLPGSRANIDHLAVGPGGVTVIDAKNYKGKVRVERRGGLLRPRTEHLLVAGRERTKLVEGVEKQVAVVEASLATADVSVSVRGALCFVAVDGLPLLGHLSVREIAVDGPRHVARIASRDGDVDVDRIVRMLAVAFPIA